MSLITTSNRSKQATILSSSSYPQSTVTSISRSSPQKKRLRPVRLSDRESPHGVPNTWLVESPRKIQFERTFLGAPNPLADALELFYEDIFISRETLFSARAKCEVLMDYIMPRITKLGNNIGMKILGRVYAGSTFDDTQVIDPLKMDVFVTFERHKTKLESVEAGYRILPLRRHRAKRGAPPDQWRFGRSDDELYLSSLKVAYNMYELIERALKLDTNSELQEFTIKDGEAQIQIKLKDGFLINIIPACFLDKEDLYLTARPYTNDIDPIADHLWRVSYFNKERRIIAHINSADRGIRRKAFLCLKALVQIEHTLHGLTSYHIKTVLMHSFDDIVDSTPRWQRNTIDSCFLHLLSELSGFLDDRNLPNFFLKTQNLFENMNPGLVASLKSRVAFLVNNHNEILRVLKKHTQ